ncbi:MAG: MerR family transcriptional regulator [Prevotellaceae bacterium]|jgi:DNA-binding transcriptional MerR regulator|nr:MerR family transcriptional regulator [Prevotellaceae bacterium]
MEKEFTEKYKKISKVEENLNVPQSTLRVWGKSFKEVLPVFTKNNTRYYTAENIEMLKDIKHLLNEEGYTHAGALEKLKNDLFRKRKKRKVMELLEDLKKELTDIRLELNQPSAMAETVIV